MSPINLSRCKPCIAVANKRFPQQQQLYDFPLRNLSMEPPAMIFASERRWEAPIPSSILPFDENNDKIVWN